LPSHEGDILRRGFHPMITLQGHLPKDAIVSAFSNLPVALMQGLPKRPVAGSPPLYRFRLIPFGRVCPCGE